MTTDLTPRDEELLRRLIAQSIAAHQAVDLDDPADYWYRLGQRNAHAHAAGLLIAGPDDVRADAIADRITLLLSDSISTPGIDELYAAALAPFPPASVHPGIPTLQWLEPKAWAAARPRDPNSIDHQYGSTWGPHRDTLILWAHQPNAAVGTLYAHDLTWDEYAVLAERVDSRDVDAAHVAACRSHLAVTAETFTTLLPISAHGREPEPADRDVSHAVPEVAPAGPALELGR